MTRAELIARVESAEGADRELDCRIWWCLATNLPFDLARVVVPDFGQWQVPNYTGSLDAAMMLVEPWMDARDIATLFAEAFRSCERAKADPRKHLARFVVAACLRAGGE